MKSSAKHCFILAKKNCHIAYILRNLFDACYLTNTHKSNFIHKSNAFLYAFMQHASFPRFPLRFMLESWIEVPEIIGSEQHCFRVLQFFSADSENIKILALFRSENSGLFQRQSALNHRCSALIFLALKQQSADLL